MVRGKVGGEGDDDRESGPAIQSLRNTRRSRKSMKKKSSGGEDGVGNRSETPASSARTPNSAFSGGNTG